MFGALVVFVFCFPPPCNANMRFLPLLSALICLLSGALCAESTAGKFDKFHALSRSGPLDLDDSSFNAITSTPRDYHTAVLLTATDARFGCVLCRLFEPEWELIARSWNKGFEPESTPRTLFGTLDFNNGKTVFQKAWHTGNAVSGSVS